MLRCSPSLRDWGGQIGGKHVSELHGAKKGKRGIPGDLRASSESALLPPFKHRRLANFPKRNIRKLFDVGDDVSFHFLQLVQKALLLKGSSRTHHVTWAEIDASSADTAHLPLETVWADQVISRL